jgi:glyoxylase-like metal-dependent hydrolase (beta-lactamase superfamily II)
MSEPLLEKIGDNVYAWIGAGGDSNAGAVLTSDGLLAIDAQKTANLGQRFRYAIEAQSGRSTTQLISTHFHLDHTAGNIAFADIPIVAHTKTAESITALLGESDTNRWVVSDRSDRLRLLFGANVHELIPRDSPLEQWFFERFDTAAYKDMTLVGPSVCFDNVMSFQLDEGIIHAEYWGPGHCDGDVIIHLPIQKIAFLGDLLFVGRFPWLGDCDLDGWIRILGRVLTLDLEVVVPGHGRLCSLEDVADFRALLTSLREEVWNAVIAGRSEDEAAAEVELPRYAAMQRYREWLPSNVRSAYRYLRATHAQVRPG